MLNFTFSGMTQPSGLAVERPHIRFFVPSIQKLYDEYKEAGVFHEKTALRVTPWGTREFAFYDPYSNGLTFYRDI
jgi:uncharacterized glyoxalase superfamily protein PhnB